MRAVLVLPAGIALLLAACGGDGGAPITPALAPSSAVSPAAAPGQPASPVHPAPPLVAAGAGSQWTILLRSHAAEIRSVDGLDEIFPMPNGMRAGTPEWRFGSGGHGATLRLSDAPCKPPTPDAWSRTVTAMIDGRAYEGCAVPLDHDDPAAGSNAVYDMLGALRSCLARAQADDAVIMWADRGPGATVLARVRMSDGTPFDCMADAAGDRVRSFTSADEANDREHAALYGFAATTAGFNSMRCELAPATLLNAAGTVVGYIQRGQCETNRDTNQEDK